MHRLGVTANPNDAWVTQVARKFTSHLEKAGRRFRFLVRDPDTKFTASFDAASFDAVLAPRASRRSDPIASPRANAFAEAFMPTVPEDCLDYLLVVSRKHLEDVLAEYFRHHNEARPTAASISTSRSPSW